MNRTPVENANANAMINVLLSEFSGKPAEERASILIRNFFDAAERTSTKGRPLSDELTTLFNAWFDDPHDRAAKDRAMDRLIGAFEAKLQGFETFRKTL